MPRIPEKLREDRREAILQAAVECLAEHGYAGTSMRTIAEAVGLTKGGLYPYFENKDAILLAVAERYIAHVAELLAPHEGMAASDQLARYLELLASSYNDRQAERARRAVLDLWLSAGDNPVVRLHIERRFQVLLAGLADVVRRGQAEGAFRADVLPEHVAGLILAARDGMIFQSLKLGADIPGEELTRFLQSLLADVLAPRAPA